jgi:hypothetical protein
VEADHRAQAGAAGCRRVGEGARQEAHAAKIILRGAAQQFAQRKIFLVVVTTTAVPQYYFSERFFRADILL